MIALRALRMRIDGTMTLRLAGSMLLLIFCYVEPWFSGAIAVVLAVWLIRPYLRAFEGSVSVLIVLTTLAASIFAGWNAADEYYSLGTEKSVVFITLVWLVIPYANALVGVLSRSTTKKHVSLTLSILYAMLYLHYALNGSTQGEEGAEHMHVIFIPPYTVFMSLLVLAMHRLLEGLTEWWRPGREHRRTNQEDWTG